MNTLYRFGLILFGIIIIGVDAFGFCLDGRHPSVQEEYKTSDIVVIGLVTAKQDVSTPDDPQGIDKTIYDIKVVRLFKGHNKQDFKISSDNTSSRFPMVVGTKYIVFVKLSSGEGVVDSCGNSGEIENRKNEIEVLTKSNLGDQWGQIFIGDTSDCQG